jgi:hypothetical protein
MFWSEISPMRRRALVWPREHGAWGILFVSLVTGAAAGFSSMTSFPRLLWLTLAATAAFSLRTPVENRFPASPLRPRSPAEWRWVNAAIGAYALSCAFAVGMLWRDGALGLVWIPGVAAAGLFALQVVVKRAGRVGRVLGEIAGAFGLAVVALAGWAVAAGRFGPEAYTLWLMNGLFATNQILYVQLRIHETRGSTQPQLSRNRLLFLAGEVLTTMVLVAAWRARLIPGLAVLAFLPILVRGGVWSVRSGAQPLKIHRLGKTELAHAILFGLLVIAGFRLHVPYSGDQGQDAEIERSFARAVTAALREFQVPDITGIVQHGAIAGKSPDSRDV